MATIILKSRLRRDKLCHGGGCSGVCTSVLWMQARPGEGPRLHAHPYPEIFVVQEGHATFTVGEDTIEVDGGQIVIAPAHVPHTFLNSGEGLLRQITIHPSPQVITQWLES